MPNIEERLQAIEREHRTLEREHQTLEQEYTQLKKTIELQTIAIGALVTKSTLEKLNEKYDRLFETLTTHDHFTNVQLAEIRTQQIELDGKIVGQQTEMRQHFTEVNDKVTGLDGKVVGLQTEMRQRFSQVDTHFDKIDARFEKVENRLDKIEVTMVTKEDLATMENRLVDTFKQLLNKQASQ